MTFVGLALKGLNHCKSPRYPSPLSNSYYAYLLSTVLEKQDESDAEKHAKLADKQFDIPHYCKFRITTVT